MKKIIGSIFAAVLLLAFVVYSQSRQSGQLAFTMTPIKDNVVLLEPIPLKFTIENRTDAPLPLNTPLILERIKLSIEKPDGQVVTMNRLTFLNSRTFGGTGPIPAGRTYEKKDVLEFELLKWFDKPGQYRLKATLPNGDSNLSSDWVNLTVEEPIGSDAQAFEFLRDNVTDPSVVLSAPPNIREAIVEQFPSSPYADYMRYVMARSYAEKDKPKAISLFKELQSKPGFAFSEEVNKELKRLDPPRTPVAKQTPE